MIKVTQIQKDFDRFDQLLLLYKLFYEGMNDQGLMLPLANNGETFWLDSVKLKLGKLANVYIAESDGILIGFSSGYIKLLPGFLGGGKVGFIDGIYLLPEYRKTGIALGLYEALEVWFAEQKVVSVELQVLLGNQGGIKFWEKMGYKTELQQMRKLV